MENELFYSEESALISYENEEVNLSSVKHMWLTLKRRHNRIKNRMQKVGFVRYKAVGRLENTIKSREHSLTHCREWTDNMFRIQTGLSRPLFNHILKNMGEYMRPTDVVMAERAYGTSICNELKLHITMRMLKGAKYVDMDWYSVSVWHVWDISTTLL